MFFKYASNILQDLSDECMLKSFSCENQEDAKLYKSIARRVDWLITQIGVEESLMPKLKNHD